MKRADLVAMFKRIDRAFHHGNRYGAVGMSPFAVKDIVLREVNRALRGEKAERHMCLYCRTMLEPLPVLCQDCICERGAAGIDQEAKKLAT